LGDSRVQGSYFYPDIDLKFVNLMRFWGVGAFKIIILRSATLALGSLNQKLYLDIKIGLNLENPIRNESADQFSQVFETLGILYRLAVFNIDRLKYFNQDVVKT